MVTPSHSIITTEENITTEDQFKISKQASDRSWDNRHIMANKTDIIIHQNDSSWENVNSGEEKNPSATR